MRSFDEIRERYIAERPGYERLTHAVAERLGSATRAAGLRCRIDPRTKEVHSLVKKALYKGLDYSRIPDKAGVRLTYAYPSQLDGLEGLVRREFVVLKREDKTEALEPHELKYLGIHYEVKFGDEDPQAPASLGLEDPVCEVQLHTRQQAIWAAYSHDLVYKPLQDPPAAVKRAVHRLLALVELFDSEIQMARDRINQQAGGEIARLLDRLERTFYTLTARTYDTDLSRSLLEAIVPLYKQRGLKAEEELDRFLNDAGAKVRNLYAQYGDDDRANPLLFQPEALLLFDRITEEPAQLEAVFVEILPRDVLVDLADIWGAPIE